MVFELQKLNYKPIILDGDDLRKILGANADKSENYSSSARLEIGMQYSQLCKLISSQGFIVLIATISMFKEVHIWNRQYLPSYFEVYLKVPIEELRRRDHKKIYSKYDSGNLTNVVGLDLLFDEPEASDYVIEFKKNQSPRIIANQLLEKLKKRNFL